MTALPYEVVCDTADRDAWIAARTSGFGASEAADIMLEGRNEPIELWGWKTGREERPDIGDREYVWLGQMLEPVVRAAYERKSDRVTSLRPKIWDPPIAILADSIARPWAHQQLLRSTQWPWLLATLDAWTYRIETVPNAPSYVDIEWVPLELKTTGPWGIEQWADEVPRPIWWQLQQQMAVTGSRWASVACLVAGQQLVWEDVERDNEAIERLANRSERLWQHVLDDTVPDHEPTRASVRVLYPAGSEDPHAELPLVGREWLDLDEERERLRAAEAEVKRAKAAIDARLKEAIGGASAGVLDDGTRYLFRSYERKDGAKVRPLKRMEAR